jgi:hypothetical protein
VQPQQPELHNRPVDVGTGVGLWLTALPLLVIGQAVDIVITPGRSHAPAMMAVSAVFLFVLSAVVITFVMLMWHRYRWARTLLTGGGAASIYAVTGIIGSVLIAGGVFLLHRKDAQAYFTR